MFQLSKFGYTVVKCKAMQCKEQYMDYRLLLCN